MRALLITLALVLASSPGSGSIAQTPQASPAQSPSIDDATLWTEFEQWSEHGEETLWHAGAKTAFGRDPHGHQCAVDR